MNKKQFFFVVFFLYLRPCCSGLITLQAAVSRTCPNHLLSPFFIDLYILHRSSHHLQFPPPPTYSLHSAPVATPHPEISSCRPGSHIHTGTRTYKWTHSAHPFRGYGPWAHLPSASFPQPGSELSFGFPGKPTVSGSRSFVSGSNPGRGDLVPTCTPPARPGWAWPCGMPETGICAL